MTMQPSADAIDVIGDVHGCATLLKRLLDRLGYRRNRDGVWQHPQRRVLFLGDLIDRGPEIVETVEIARAMAERGFATVLLGNHEISALTAFFLRDERRVPRIHKETIEQYRSCPERWRDTLKWLLECPLCIDAGSYRAVHACWDEALAAPFLDHHPDGRIDRYMLMRACDPQSFSHMLFGRLTRGPQLALPDGRSMTSRDGVTRRTFRTSFWAIAPRCYQDVVFQPDPLPEDIAQRPLDDASKRRLVFYGPDQPPLFFGHYWRQGHPELIGDNLACLDYSGVKGGHLVAYRFDGERRLSADKLVWVTVDDPADIGASHADTQRNPVHQ